MRTSPGPGLGISRSTISNGPLALPTCTTLIFFAPAMMESSARFISKLIRLHQAALMRRKEHTVHEIRLQYVGALWMTAQGWRFGRCSPTKSAKRHKLHPDFRPPTFADMARDFSLRSNCG